MSVYKKPGSKYWWYDFTFKGKRIQKSTKVENEREATNIEKAAWTQFARGEVSIQDKPTAERKSIGQLLDALQTDLTARKKDKLKNLNLIATVRNDFKDRWADGLTTAGVIQYVSSLRKPSKTKGRRTKSLSDSTIKHRLGILSQAYELENIAREEAKLEPLMVPRFPKLSSGNCRSGFLNRAQFDVLLSHLPEDLRDFVLFAYITGWRKGAIASLEWSDVRDGNIYLRGVKSKNGAPYYVPILGKELVQLIERREKTRTIKTDNGAVICSLVFHRSNEPIQEFRKSWATACKKAGCEGRIFHDMRRSGARNLIRSGVSKDVAKMVGGWKTDSMFSRYNVTGEEDLRDAMQKINQYNEAQSRKVVQIAK